MAERGGEARWNVFLAYASPDRARARQLHDALKAQGLRVCFDQTVLQGGDDWHQLLPEYIRSSQVIVALVSESTPRAHFQRSEVIQAIRLVRDGGRLIPVRLSPNAELPYGTEQLHALDLFTDDDVGTVAAQITATVPGSAPVGGPLRNDRIPRPPRYFSGRDELLAELAQNPGRTVVLTAIHGMGGVGKTSLAAAYVEAHRDEFDIQWWLRSEDPSLLVADLVELAPHLGLPTAGRPDEIAAAVRRALEATDRRWLLLFDNAPDERSIAPWVPHHGNGSVLVTSRNPTFADADMVLEVDTLPRAAAEEFLRRRVAVPADEDLAPVLDRLGGLPLALEQAAAWVSQIPSRRFAQFVALYDDAATDPFPDGTKPTGYDHTATTTWRVSMAAAMAAAPLAERILALLAFLAPEPLPCQWLREIADDRYLDSPRRRFRRQAASAATVQDALDALHRYSLATIASDDTVTVHRVVQSVTRRTAPTGSVDAAVRLLGSQSSSDADEPSRWPTMARLTPHALAVDGHGAGAGPRTTAILCWTLTDVAAFQSATGALHNSVRTAERVHDIAVQRFGLSHPDTFGSRVDLGRAYHRAGDPERAVPLYEAALAGYERTLGPHHLNAVASRSGLANAYQDTGDPERAIPLHEAALADLERLLGPDHPDTLASRGNLANAYLAIGDSERAIPLLETTLADHERTFGPDHPQTLGCLYNLANAYHDTGDPERAIPLHEAALAGRERVLGGQHPDSLASRHELGASYHATGEVERAIALYQAALDGYERSRGPDSAYTLASRKNLENARRQLAERDGD